MKTIVAIFLIAFSVNSFAQEKKTEAELLNFVNDSLVVSGRIQSSKFLQLMRDLNTSKEDSTWIDGFVQGLGYVATLSNTTELNILDGALVSTAELNRLVGVTANIQTQLNAKVDTTQIDSAAYYTSAQVDSIVVGRTMFTLRHSNHTSFAPADASTYYIGAFEAAGGQTTANIHTYQMPFAAKVIGVNCIFRSTNTASTETFSVYLRINNTTDSLLTSSAAFGQAYDQHHYTVNDLDIPLAANDKIETKIVFPTWVTNPETVFCEFIYYIQRQ